MDSDGTSDSPDAIITDHGGNMTITREDKIFANGIRMTLPTALAEEPADLQSSITPRPISYEFDLFHQPGQEALGKEPLRKLAFAHSHRDHRPEPLQR